MWRRVNAFAVFLDAAHNLSHAFGYELGSRIMRSAASVAEKAAAGKPIRGRGRPKQSVTYCPYRLAIMILFTSDPTLRFPDVPDDIKAKADAFCAKHGSRFPSVRGSGHRRLAYVLYHGYPGEYGSSPEAILQRIKEVQPIVNKLRMGDQPTWAAAYQSAQAQAAAMREKK